MEGKDLNIEIRFIGIEIISKNMVERPESLTPIVTYNFDIKVQTKVISDQKLLVPHVTVKINELNTSQKLAEIKVACLFNIKNFNDVIKRNEESDVYHIPKELELIIRPVAISTTRGIIYSEFRGTYLANAIMPIVFMDTMKEEKVDNKNSPS